MPMSVEKRRRPTWIGNTGVLVPCTMACTAIGMEGVPVKALVAVAAGDGVMTKEVDVAGAGVDVLVAEAGTPVVVDREGFVLGTIVGCGVGGRAEGRFVKNRTAATATDKKPATKDQRARTT